MPGLELLEALREVPVELEAVVKVASAWCEDPTREADSRMWRTLDSYMMSLMRSSSKVKCPLNMYCHKNFILVIEAIYSISDKFLR